MADQAGNGLVPGGPAADEPAGIRDDDFGLEGDLKTALARALESRWNADDPGATTLDDEPLADTAATPVPATETSAPGTQEPVAEDGGGGERAAADGAATVAETPPAAEPPADDQFDAAAYFNDYFGTPLDKDQAANLARMIGGLQALSPDQRAELDRVLAGGQTGVYPATQGQPIQPQQQVAPQVDASDPAAALLGPRPDDEYLAAQWDMSAAVARQQHADAEALRADIGRNTQLEMQRQMEAAQVKISAAETNWRAQYPVITDAEFDALRDRASRSGTFPALVAAHHGDVDAATRAIYEQQFWSDPSLRERAIANVASGRVAGDSSVVDPASPVAQQQQTVDQGRQALAASVSGGGGSVTPTTSEAPSDPSKRKQAMISELAQHDFT